MGFKAPSCLCWVTVGLQQSSRYLLKTKKSQEKYMTFRSSCCLKHAGYLEVGATKTDRFLPKGTALAY